MVPLHIGVFSYYYLPIVNGVTMTIADWKRAGEKYGNRFTICIPNAGDTDVNTEIVQFPAFPIYKRFGITMPMFPELFIEKELRKRNIDILHVHHPFNIGNLSLFAKKKLSIPLVFTYHTRYADYFSSYLPWFSGEIMAGIVTRMLVRFMNACDAVTVANESLKHELFRQGVHRPIFIVPLGVDTTAFAHIDRWNARARFGFKQHDHVLLFVGRFAKEKNMYFLMRAFERLHNKLSDTKLLLVGNGIEEQRLRSFVHRKKLAQHVVFATKETIHTIPDVYAAADMFVYASQTETYGRVIVEAMAAGLPIVALAGPSIVDLLQDGINGTIVFKKSPRLFADIALKILRNKEKQKFLGEHAKDDARQKYDSTVSWKLLSDVYQTLLMSVSKTPAKIKFSR